MKLNPGHLFKKIRLSMILLLTYLVIVCVVIAVFSYSSFINSRELYIEKTSMSTYSLMEQQNNQINSQVQFIIEACFDIARNDELLRILSNYKNSVILDQVEYDSQIKKILINYWKLKEQIFNIVIFVENKKFVSDYSNGVCPINIVQEYDWFKTLGQKTGVLIDSHKIDYLEKIKDKNVTTSLVKITDLNGRIAADGRENNDISGTISDLPRENAGDANLLGIVAIDILEDYFFESCLKKLKINSNSDIYIINSQGIVISAEGKKDIGKPHQLNAGIDALNEKRDGGYRKINLNGKPVLLIYTQTSNIGWRIVQLVSVDEIYAGEDQNMKSVLTTIIISLLLIMPIIILISRFLSQPIIRLAKRMNSVRDGQINKIDETTYGMEVYELYNSYNFMAERINDLLSDIQHANKIQRQTEIKALQAQINPHFLYNTLDSINWMALENNIPDISKMVTMLSRLFRLSLSKGRTVYRLGDELEQVGYYLEIQKIRFKNRFNYYIEADEHLKDYYIPKLILQPLVENSLVHGFQKTLAGGVIMIIAKIIGERIIIDVTDNGMGIPEEKAQRILSIDSSEGGYGIKNVHERIKYTCGETYGLQYIFDSPEGTNVRIELPVISAPDDLRQ